MGNNKIPCMSPTIKRLPNGFGAEVHNFDGGRINIKTSEFIKQMLYKNRVLILKNQFMTQYEYVVFAKQIGKPVLFIDPEYQHPDYPEIFVISNAKAKGKKIGKDRVGYYWHSDSSFLTMPLPITMVYAQCVPKQGGETAFINMHEVYSTLPESTKEKLYGKYARHEGKWRYILTQKDVGLSILEVLERDEQLVPSSAHPIIIKHPFTGETILYINEGFTKRIFDISYEESEGILQKLFKIINENRNIYMHSWKLGDLVIWDNRSVIHRAFPAASGQDRIMFRIGVNDGKFY
ncbi:MAG: hypothetical protein A3F41_03150 [Coxiella sp. RIFCSPHIGHO2_12_FULL_44_14]|nr:MAG: hypothetical protein A3F41_03150 [Coxiella sp. RIFCSPHIGHO2_12_FULL_44_14]